VATWPRTFWRWVEWARLLVRWYFPRTTRRMLPAYTPEPCSVVYMGPPVDRCTSYRPEVMCATRRDAITTGEMFYSVHRRGWIFPAENRAVPRDMIRNGIPPATWPTCPFCGGALPDAETIVRHLLEKPPTMFGEGDE
jgi:hypothetical protein